jgi:hypothetical protein
MEGRQTPAEVLCRRWSLFIEGGHVKSLKVDGFGIFTLFFGLGVIQAFQTHDWIKAAFWLVMGSGFLLAENLKRRI